MEMTALNEIELQAAGGVNPGGVASGIGTIAIGVGMVLAPEVTVPVLIVGLGTAFVGGVMAGYNAATQ